MEIIFSFVLIISLSFLGNCSSFLSFINIKYKKQSMPGITEFSNNIKPDINILDLFISFNPLFDSLNITILINKLINNKNEFAITSSFIFPLDK